MQIIRDKDRDSLILTHKKYTYRHLSFCIDFGEKVTLVLCFITKEEIKKSVSQSKNSQAICHVAAILRLHLIN